MSSSSRELAATIGKGTFFGVVATAARLLLAGTGPLAVLVGASATLAAVYVASVVALGVPVSDERDAVRRYARVILGRVGAHRRNAALRDVPRRAEVER